MAEYRKTSASASQIPVVKRTTLSLSLTEEDKLKLKIYAASKGKTIAGVVKDWIDSDFGGDFKA